MRGYLKSFFFFLACFSFTYANDLDTALKQADLENKLVLVEITRDFCPYCERMEKSVLNKADVKVLIKKKYVFLKLNLSHDEIPYIFSSKLTPTFYFLNEKGEILEELMGLMKKSDFIFYLNEISSQEKN
jgi:thioredoxin-related protein